MASREEKVVTWLIPSLMAATLSLVGWMAVNISRISESMAVTLYRVETQAADLKEMRDRMRVLEMYVGVKQPQQR